MSPLKGNTNKNSAFLSTYAIHNFFRADAKKICGGNFSLVTKVHPPLAMSLSLFDLFSIRCSLVLLCMLNHLYSFIYIIIFSYASFYPSKGPKAAIIKTLNISKLTFDIKAT